MNANERIIVALDADYSLEDIKRLAGLLGNKVGMLKVGKRLFTRFGPQVLDIINDAGARIFLDLKYHDIPNTVAQACEEAVKHGVAMMNVHASGGSEMMRRAKAAVDEKSAELGVKAPLLIAVTVLTSLDESALLEIGFSKKVKEQVEHLALLTKKCGLDGVVAAPGEAGIISKACGPDFLVVTPGIRPFVVDKDDQKRAVTPKMALEYGSDYLVIGRPIVAAEDPLMAVEKIVEGMQL